MQEGCLRAFARLDQWQPGTRLDSWMFRIIHNIWIDQKRALKVRGTTVNLDDAPELAGSDGRDETEHRLTLNRVLESMDRLPAEHRELIALVSIEGVSYQEAAAILDIPLGTVTSGWCGRGARCTPWPSKGLKARAQAARRAVAPVTRAQAARRAVVPLKHAQAARRAVVRKR